MGEILLNDYNNYRLQTENYSKLKQSTGKPIRSLKVTPDRIRAFETMHEYCEDHGIDSRHWLYTLFVSRHWRFSPPLNQLCSPKHLKRYHDTDYGTGFQTSTAVPVFDPRVDMSTTVEMMKGRYINRGDPGGCMSDGERTHGYHPKSKWCCQCPIAAACEARLKTSKGYDTTALRNGEITVTQAMTMAAYYVGH